MSSIRVERPQSIREVLCPVAGLTAVVLKLTGVVTWSWWWVLSPVWIGVVFGVKMFRPQSTAGRCWDVAQDVVFPVAAFTAIVLKLTGVITWSWWWVLVPVWTGAAVLALVVTLVTLFIVCAYLTRQQRRSSAEI